MGELDKYMNEISGLCATHKVRNLYAFGSVLTNQFNPKSDVDFIVDFDPVDSMHYADNYYDLKFSLIKILNRDIDLLEEKAIKNPYLLQAINTNKKLVYGH